MHAACHFLAGLRILPAIVGLDSRLQEIMDEEVESNVVGVPYLWLKSLS